MSKRDRPDEEEEDFGPPLPPPAADDDEEDFGPPRPPPAAEDEKAPEKKKRKKKVYPPGYFKIAQSRLPSAQMYERSYMHRDHVSHVVVTKTQFLITVSRDGNIKFWKKENMDVEFAKQYKAHLGPVNDARASLDGFLLATVGEDKGLKIFSVQDFDMIDMLKLDYVPRACEWIHARSTSRGVIAVSNKESPEIYIYNASGGCKLVHTVKAHTAPVCWMRFNPKYKAVISLDSSGMTEYWTTEDEYDHPKTVKFQFKTETSLYELLKNKTTPTSLELSPNCEMFSIMARDRFVRIFNFATGKMIKQIDDTFALYEKQQLADSDTFKLDGIDFGRRMAVERELHKSSGSKGKMGFVPPSNVLFDESGNFIFYATPLGIKVINIKTNTLVKLLGKVENTERFLSLTLFQGMPTAIDASQGLQMGAGAIMAKDAAIINRMEDPCIFTCAFKKNRFYCFSTREPEDGDPNAKMSTGRDVFNEKPLKDIHKMAAQVKDKGVGHTVIMHTTMGDLTFTLHTEECPKTVENFTTHAKNGYYDGTIFHRIIPEFMIQGGDPQGDGTGGESIWGGEFEDEFHRDLRHDRAGILSMANAGPGTNGSQFFITTVPCPWLDNKHTVFGRVEKGMDVIHSVEKVKTKESRPLIPIKIINIELK